MAFILLITLACVGIGISGGVPLPLLRNRRDFEKEDIELVEKKTEVSEEDEIQFRG